MEYISVFDMLKIGVGPSSSHTLGPWRAAEAWIKTLDDKHLTKKVSGIIIDLYGSLSLTGKGHATDMALVLGLSGCDPERIEVEQIPIIIADVQKNLQINFAGSRYIPFDFNRSIHFNNNFLPFHSNGMRFTAIMEDGSENH